MYSKTLLSLLLLFPAIAFAQTEPPLGNPLLPSDTGAVYKVVERMPLFPGCDTTLSYAEQKQCADLLMIEYIYGLLHYPEDAIAEGIEGMAVVSFVVERDGRLTNLKCPRPVCPSIKSEALYIVDAMALDLPPWVPGLHYGKAVRVQFNLPIKFRLPRD